jgi:hypothetical protein
MKLGIFLLIFGLLLAAVGVFAWQYAESSMWEAIIGHLFGYHEQYEHAVLGKAAGLALTVFGGGLALGGIVRMIVKR